ncbi:MAG TPA: GNAT family N-acetyltransferase [Steroidobacteraceae bacterium]|jgi:GNAT superfamily N-acetyltransferase|nr:GNAT family N-acetyltransferase [Steroidobacteraceae bacterium]
MNIEISTDQDRLDVPMIHAFLANDSYWVPGISRSSVEKCIRHSFCFGVYTDGRQIGFARVVTDFVRFAHVLDVFILPEFRGLGLAKLLMENILAHPELRTIVRYTLGTQDAHGLYARYGFKAPANPERQMELLRPQSPPAPPSTAPPSRV